MKKIVLLLFCFWFNFSFACAVEIDIKKAVNKVPTRYGESEVICEYPQIKTKDKTVDEIINAHFKKSLINKDPVKSCKVNIKYVSNEMLSILMGNYYHNDMQGAAHGMPAHMGEVFDVKTGKKLKLKDLFLADSKYAEIINPIIKQKIDEIDFIYKAEFKSIEEDENFYITDEFLVIVYPPYLYTNFAQSPLYIRISFEEFKNILKYSLIGEKE